MKLRKFIYQLLIALLLSSNTYSHDYIPLPEDSLVRWVMRYEYGDQGVCHEIYYYDYRMIGDTTISGKTYKKIYSENLFLFSSQYGNPGCSYPPGNSYIAAFRQDSLSKKAFLVLPGQVNDTLLYDFNLGIGDTLFSVINDFSWGLGCANYNIIYLIDSVLIGSDYHQWQRFGCASGVVEGIGSLDDPFQKTTMAINSHSLVCVKRDTAVIFDDTGYGVFCFLINDINERIETSVEIYPSPANNFIEFKLSGNNLVESVTVFNTFGEIVFKNYELSQQRFSVQNWHDGIYLVWITTTNGMTFCRKIIVVK